MNIAKYLILLVFAGAIFSCEEKLEVWNSDVNRIGFKFDSRLDSITAFTFLYHPTSSDIDTIWVDLITFGLVENFDRPVKIEQISTDDDNLQAEPGKHYISLDDPLIAKHLNVPAGSNKASIPIVVKRDPSLKNGKYYIKLKVVKNEYFDLSFPKDNEKIIEISDIIRKPQYWNSPVEREFAGQYGDEKYKFMIDVATWTLDEKWFEDNFRYGFDQGYVSYLSKYFSEKLKELNRQLQSEGKGFLREKPVAGATEGVLVQFTLKNKPLPVI